jgi:hypothetical protein
LLSLVTELADAQEQFARIQAQIAALAKEHGVQMVVTRTDSHRVRRESQCAADSYDAALARNRRPLAVQGTRAGPHHSEGRRARLAEASGIRDHRSTMNKVVNALYSVCQK